MEKVKTGKKNDLNYSTERKKECKTKLSRAFQYLWHNIRCTVTISVPELRKNKGGEIFEDIVAENFSELMEDINQ